MTNNYFILNSIFENSSLIGILFMNKMEVDFFELSGDVWYLQAAALNHPHHIFWRKEQKQHFVKIWLQVTEAFISELYHFAQLFSIYQQDQCTFWSFTYTVCSCKLLFSSFFPCKAPRKQTLFFFHPRETPVYLKFESLMRILRSHNKDLF